MVRVSRASYESGEGVTLEGTRSPPRAGRSHALGDAMAVALDHRAQLLGAADRTVDEPAVKARSQLWVVRYGHGGMGERVRARMRVRACGSIVRVGITGRG